MHSSSRRSLARAAVPRGGAPHYGGLRIIAKDAGHPPGESRRHHFRIALGSAAEVAAVLDLVELPGGAEQQAQLRRVRAMLAKMGAA